MLLTSERLQTLLVPPGHVSEEDFASAAAIAQAEQRPLEEILVEKDYIRDHDLGQLVAEDLGVPFLSLSRKHIDAAVIHLIPEVVARARGVVALDRTARGVTVGMTDPSDVEMRHFIEKRLGEPILVHYITAADLRVALAHYKSNLQDAFAAIVRRLEGAGKEEQEEAMVSMVDTLLQYGYYNQSSDVHIEPREHKGVVRFRIDGVMHDVLELPKDLYDLVVTRIKILGRMRTDEHRAAQDGRIRYAVGDTAIDVRVSVLPVIQGENVVMRLLSERSQRLGLADLGMSESDMEIMRRAIEKPHGMILVTGPTGSGKTTTVYAVMKILNTRDVHIATIEDPVEYDVEGISQIQVNTKTDLTFAKGLRAIVRQDPDIIMVGEIRDQETADIAVNSAMTGHLVLSTLHANDAATTLPRLLDMDVEPFLVASTVNVTIAQRLVRKICMSCRSSYTIDDEERQLIEQQPALKALFTARGIKNIKTLTLYRGAGCAVCGTTGYVGRSGIFEVMEMNNAIKALILARASSDDILAAARKSGMKTMIEDGIEKVIQGQTTLSEVLRTTKL